MRVKVEMHEPYTVRHPKCRFWLFFIFAVGSGFLAARLILESPENPKWWLIGAFSVWSLYLAIYILAFRLQFTDERIIRVRLFSKKVSQPYSNIVELEAGIGSWVIKFVDGQSIKIDYDLSDQTVISNYLEKYAFDAMRPRRDK